MQQLLHLSSFRRSLHAALQCLPQESDLTTKQIQNLCRKILKERNHLKEVGADGTTLKWILGGDGVHGRYREVPISCEHGNETSSSITGFKFLKKYFPPYC
jgi:hypothetical protein